jgi:hypothetical protein
MKSVAPATARLSFQIKYHFVKSLLSCVFVCLVIVGLTFMTIPAALAIEFDAILSLQFDKELPKNVVIGGDSALVVNEQIKMKSDQIVPLNYDIKDPKEAKLSVTANWPDDSFITYQFSFLPSQLEKRIVIFFESSTSNNIRSREFNEANLTKLSKEICNGAQDDQFHLMRQYNVCYEIFKAFENKSKRHTKSAFRSLKGAFDAYYRLVVRHDFGLARDKDLEQLAISYEAESTTSAAIASTFNDFRVKVGYFAAMVGEIGKSSTFRFDRLRRDVQSLTTSESAMQAKVELVLTERRFADEQVRLRGFDGKNHNIVNGLSEAHFNDVDRVIRNLNLF